MAQAVLGQVAPKLGMTITRADYLCVTGASPGQCVWGVIEMAAIAAMEPGRRFMAVTLRGGGDQQGEPS